MNDLYIVITVFSLPVLIIFCVSIFGYLDKKNKLKVIEKAVDNNFAITPEMLEALSPATKEKKEDINNYMIASLILIGIGIGLSILIYFNAGSMANASVGAIPLFIGIALLVIWLIRRKDNNQQNCA